MFNLRSCEFELLDLSRGAHNNNVRVRMRSANDTRTEAFRLSVHSSNSAHRHSVWQNFPWQHLVAGAAGGAISRTATAPLELLRLQAMTASRSVGIQNGGGSAVLRQHPNLLQSLQAAAGKQGWQGLWRGNGLNVLRAGPQKAIDFFSFELYKGWVGQRLGCGPVSVLSSAALAGATSTVILHPLEVVRSRMTCDQVGRYSHGIAAAFTTIAKTEGPLVFYTGLAPALAAIMPEAAITYGCFDLLTKAYMRASDKDKPGVGVAVAAGVASSVLGHTVSFPLETVARRLQVGTASVAKANAAKVVRKVLQEGGLPGFYRGYGVGVLRAVPMSALSFGAYELVRTWLALQSGSLDITPSQALLDQETDNSLEAN